MQKNPVNIQVSKWIVENNGNNGDNKIEKKIIYNGNKKRYYGDFLKIIWIIFFCHLILHYGWYCRAWWQYFYLIIYFWKLILFKNRGHFYVIFL